MYVIKWIGSVLADAIGFCRLSLALSNRDEAVDGAAHGKSPFVHALLIFGLDDFGTRREKRLVLREAPSFRL